MANDTWQTAASADDCTCDVDDNFMQPLTNTWWGFPRDGDGSSERQSGARFLTVTIPKDSTINSATLEGCAYANYSNTVYTKIYGEDVDDASTFSTAANFKGRGRTTAAVDWDISAAWTQGNWYTSSDISTIIQEIVNRAGWVSGNDLVIFVQNDGTTGTTRRNFYTWDQSGNTSGPKLNVDWTPPASVSVPVMMHHYNHHINKIIRG